MQAVETVLEAIVPEQFTWLFHRLVEKYSSGGDGNLPDNLLLARLIKLYEKERIPCIPGSKYCPSSFATTPSLNY